MCHHSDYIHVEDHAPEVPTYDVAHIEARTVDGRVFFRVTDDETGIHLGTFVTLEGAVNCAEQWCAP